MSMTEWMIRGQELVTCNCSFGCPCQFNSLPTFGDCRAAVGVRIDTGHYGNVKLDGLNIGLTVAWPTAIHLGHGEIQHIIDERATKEQREALVKILAGEDTEPGKTFFQVFVAMCDTIREPLFSQISFGADLDTCEGHFSVPGVVEARTNAIRNPVTGNVHHAKVSLRAGFEYSEAEMASGSAKSAGPIQLDWSGSHAHLADLHITGQGIVH